MRLRQILTAGALAITGPVLLVSPVAADPKGSEFSQTCGQQTYQIVVGGNGHWTPAHDRATNRVFHPTEFNNFSGVMRDASGNVVDSFTETFTETRGQSGEHLQTVDCTYSFTEVSDGSDPEFPEGYTFSGTGGVTGYFSGK